MEPGRQDVGLPLTPEQQARVEIDRLLEAAGWHVCDYKDANIHAARGVAIREFPLTAEPASPLVAFGGNERSARIAWDRKQPDGRSAWEQGRRTNCNSSKMH